MPRDDARLFLGDDDPTAREIEVLKLMSQGFYMREVALQLHISENTVKSHIKNIHHKLSAKNTVHAVAIGYERGILP